MWSIVTCPGGGPVGFYFRKMSSGAVGFYFCKMGSWAVDADSLAEGCDECEEGDLEHNL